MHKLLIATRNSGKLEEIRAFLKQAHPRLQCLSLNDVKGLPEVVEDGSSFQENARKKAIMAATFSRLVSLADDSGLEIEALGGRPGVLSARFSGPDATDEANIQKVLDKLQGLETEKRRARFRCIMVLCAPNGRMSTSTGELEGLITEAPAGMNGFGYDPIFYVPSFGKTLAELSLSEKNRISHRTLALTKVSQTLTTFQVD